jgi:two-component system, NarL family, response regulator DesR
VIRVLVAEDQHLIRGALVALLSLERDIEVVAETDRGDTILAQVERARPDVAVLDIDLPGMDGITAAERLRDIAAPVQVLVLTSVGSANNFDRATCAGVAGFLLKDAPTEQLSKAIREVHAGRRFIDVELASDSTAAVTMGGRRVGPLSTRERGILAALYEGTSLTGLRTVLGLSDATLQAHLAGALSKTGVADPAHAARVAYDRGWL